PTILRPPRTPLFPYTTLFRSPQTPARSGYRTAGRARIGRQEGPGLQLSHDPLRGSGQPGAVSQAARLQSETLRAPRALAGRLHRSEEHTSELQSLAYLVCRLL